MKTIKMKSVFYGLMILALFSITIISCDKDKYDNTIDESEENAQTLDPINLLVTKDINEGELSNYIESLSAEQVLQYEKDYVIYEYLNASGKLQDVYVDEGENTSKYNDFSFSELDLSKFIETEHLMDLNSKITSLEQNRIVARGCYTRKVCVLVPTKTCSKTIKVGIGPIKVSKTIYYPCGFKNKCTTAYICVD